MPLQEEGVLKGQELENAVSDADYTKAIQIALELRRPHKLFELVSELCRLDLVKNSSHLSIIYSSRLTIIYSSHLSKPRLLQEERV